MQSKVCYEYLSAIGKVYLESDGICLTALKFSVPEGAGVQNAARGDDLIHRVVGQLDDYFAGARRSFDLPIRLIGTDFQRFVWEALLAIPYGETRSYGQVAAMIGNPKAARAVGLANNRNPISIIVPCHRVIGSNGSLVGYGGGLDAKRYLLDLENK